MTTFTYNLCKAHGVFFVLMYALGLTGIVFEPWNGSRLCMAFELLADLSVLCLLLHLLPSRMRHAAHVAIGAAMYALSAVDMACYVRMGMPITPMLLQLALQTNTREATEVLGSYLDSGMLMSPLSLVVIQAAAGVYVLCHESRIASRIGMHMPSRWPWPRLTTAAVWLLPVLCLATSAENKYYMLCRVVCQYSELETQKIRDFSQRTNFYLPVYRLAFALSETPRLRGEIAQFERSMLGAHVDSASHLSPHVVLIIGESYNRRHSSLYGYAKPTTPCQLRRWRGGELVPYTDMISSWNTTCESLKNMFSTYCTRPGGTWAEEPPFTLLYRQAGYHVSFFSNQYVTGRAGFSDFIEDAFFNNPHTSRLMFDERNALTHEYDLALIDDWRTSGSAGHAYTLDIFHFLGLHADFSMRYPRAFAKFAASDYARPDLSSADKAILAHYDNAVAYNDHVIDSILRLYEDRDAVVVFVPDHGERVFDSSAEWGRNLTWDAGDIRQQFEIPFWIWGSPSYRKSHQTLWRQIEEASGRRGMTDALAHLMLHLAGIHTKWYRADDDILSGGYDAHRSRMIRGERDYDRIVEPPSGPPQAQ